MKSKLRIVYAGLVLALFSGALFGCRRDVGGASAPLFSATPTPDSEAPGTAATAVVDTPTPTPTRTPPETTAIYHTIRAGETLSAIAVAYGTTVESLMRLNGMTNADQLAVGQVIQVSMDAQHIGPDAHLIPDSELVYGPAYTDFDVAAATAAFPGMFNGYAEDVEGRTMTGPEIVQLVAEQYSVGPRVLLALLELRGGWLTNPDPPPDKRVYPLGYARDYWDGLYSQLNLAANALDAGFYGWWLDTLWLIQTDDGAYIQFSLKLNAGTAGVQRALASGAADYDAWTAELARFATVYRDLFGDPFTHTTGPMIPVDMASPELDLPWAVGETWYYTGGPHPGWGTLGAWSALDFTTGERNIGCMTSQGWVTAAAPGQVLVSQNGMVLQDLDGDGFLGSGWVLLYMHMASEGRVAAGTFLNTGDPVGHPSCEGGVSDAAHLHFARRYNGIWIAADDARWPMSLSGWVPASAGDAYDGTIAKGDQVRTACECWEAVNAIQH